MSIPSLDDIKKRLRDDEMRMLEMGFKRRWRDSFEKRSKSKNIPCTPAEKKACWEKLLAIYDGGNWTCGYCGVPLRITASRNSPLFFKVWSLDHKTSLDAGGNNSPSNIEVACVRCNIIKGTITAETFRELVSACNSHDSTLLDRMCDEGWNGRFASKMDREDAWKLEDTGAT